MVRQSRTGNPRRSLWPWITGDRQGLSVHRLFFSCRKVDYEALVILHGADLVGAQVFFGWPGDISALLGKSTLMARAEKYLFVFQVIDLAAQMGARPGDGNWSILGFE